MREEKSLKSTPFYSSKSVKQNSARFKHTIPEPGFKFHSILERLRSSKEVKNERSGTRASDEVDLSLWDSETISMLSEGITPWTTYNITLKGFSSVNASGGGVIAVAIPADPSAAGYNFSEWSNLAAIFSEVRILKFEVQVVPIIDNAVALTAGTPIIVGFNSTLSSAPGTEGVVATLIDSVYWSAGADRSTAGSRYNVSYDSRLDFSLTSTVTDTPYAGCPGSFQFYGSGYPNGSLVYKVLVLGTYQFRGRA